jgi:transcription initiation factor TFIIIB Brf1 subunit/transcription initiation factor TFIIB
VDPSAPLTALSRSSHTQAISAQDPTGGTFLPWGSLPGGREAAEPPGRERGLSTETDPLVSLRPSGRTIDVSIRAGNSTLSEAYYGGMDYAKPQGGADPGSLVRMLNAQPPASRLDAPPPAPEPRTPDARATPKRDAPVATNSWARRTIVSRAQQIGFAPELAREVGSVGLWYYNRIVRITGRKDATSQELPYDMNRYLVPVTLALACEFKRQPVELERLLRLSGTPSKKTVATAHEFLSKYSKILAQASRAGSSPKGPRPSPSPTPAAVPIVPPHPEYRVRAPVVAPPPPVPSAKVAPSRPVARASAAPRTALATQVSNEILQIRKLFAAPPAPGSPPKTAPRAKQSTTNAWARKRIADLSRSLGLPEHVKARALGTYEKIVDLHTRKNGAPPGKRLQLSPRLNWSLVYTTIYLACRLEEYPKDLREILGRNPRPGSLREMYGLYRFYKRELGLEIRMIDVRTFIVSWFDGFEISDLVRETASLKDSERIKDRAISIANRARGEKTFQDTSTKIIAAGALTTALAETDPPGTRASFYRAMAAFLHMSEGTIRYIVARIAEII